MRGLDTQKLRYLGGNLRRGHIVNHNVLLLAAFCAQLMSERRVTETDIANGPNLANILAGVPLASRIKTGKSGLYCLIIG